MTHSVTNLFRKFSNPEVNSLAQIFYLLGALMAAWSKEYSTSYADGRKPKIKIRINLELIMIKTIHQRKRTWAC